MKTEVINLLSKNIKQIKKEEIENLLEIPPTQEMGDFAFPTFILASKLKKNPAEIAYEISKKIKPTEGIAKIEAKGPYINFFVDRTALAKNLIKDILKKGDNYGKNNAGKGKNIMVEFPSPNTNKPFHLGHLRNMSIGESASRIIEFNGSKVIRAVMNNDRGIHICKSMVAYKKFGKNKTPEKENKKSDHFVGDYYVLFAQKNKDKKLDEEAKDCLEKWEKGDKETINLWKKMNNWALTGFKETYKLFGVKHDKTYCESKIYKNGKEIIEDALKKGLVKKKKEGAIYLNLEKEKLGEKILLRSNGTSVYITQDIYLAKLKNDDYNLDKSIYVVANEQDYHFHALSAVLKKLKLDFGKNLKHLSYGMVHLPEGRMKSREGTVVDADDLILEVKELAKKRISERSKPNKKELEKRSLVVALSAIKYALLKIDLKRDMLFNPNEAVSFEGDTGPYLLYSYARASSILRKAKEASTASRSKTFNLENLEEKEIELIKKLEEFEKVLSNSYEHLNPALIANYSYKLSQIFNEFYHACPVIDSKKKDFRLALVQSFRQVLKNGLNLLGIDILEEM